AVALAVDADDGGAEPVLGLALFRGLLLLGGQERFGGRVGGGQGGGQGRRVEEKLTSVHSAHERSSSREVGVGGSRARATVAAGPGRGQRGNGLFFSLFAAACPGRASVPGGGDRPASYTHSTAHHAHSAIRANCSQGWAFWPLSLNHSLTKGS